MHNIPAKSTSAGCKNAQLQYSIRRTYEYLGIVIAKRKEKTSFIFFMNTDSKWHEYSANVQI